MITDIEKEMGLARQYLGSELHEAIALQIHYYNTKRIHTALKMSPATYAAKLKQSSFLGAKRIDKVLQKVRG